jgi:phage terminase large subunit GpA-like protein
MVERIHPTTETGKRNEAFDCCVYAFAALEDYAGFSKPNDLLERLFKELLSDEPRQKPQFGKFDPSSKRPTPQSISPTNTGQQEKMLPRWMQNRRTQSSEFGPRLF